MCWVSMSARIDLETEAFEDFWRVYKWHYPEELKPHLLRIWIDRGGMHAEVDPNYEELVFNRAGMACYGHLTKGTA